MNLQKVVINLPSRSDRNKEMLRQLSRVGWDDAVFFDAIRPNEAGGFSSIGAHGCFLSHLNCLKEASGPLVLMEDDLNFTSDFSGKWGAALKSLPDDWSIFYPAHHIERGQGIEPMDAATKIICAHFICFRDPATMAGLLSEILAREPGHPLGGPMHVDGAYTTIRKQNPNLKTYAHFPSLGYQRSSASDITPRRISARAAGFLTKVLGL